MPSNQPLGDPQGRFLSLTLLNVTSNLTIPLAGLVDSAMLGHLPEIHFLAGVALASLIFDYLYFGLDGAESMTLEQIGGLMSLTRERVRQLKERALGKLRHPQRYHALLAIRDETEVY